MLYDYLLPLKIFFLLQRGARDFSRQNLTTEVGPRAVSVKTVNDISYLLTRGVAHLTVMTLSTAGVRVTQQPPDID